MGAEEERGADVVHRALRMLESFRQDRSELSVREMADETDLTLPTAHRVAKALQLSGFLMQVEGDHTYSLGPEVVRLAQVLLLTAIPAHLVAAAHDLLERLRDDTGETAALYCPIGRQRVCVTEVPSRQPKRMANRAGQLLPLHSGAAGKAILAWMESADIDHVLDDHPNAVRRRRELATIRKQGFALSLGETVPAAAAIAVPIRAPDSNVVGAISLAGPTERWTRQRMLVAVPVLLDSAAVLAGQAGPSAQP